MKRASLTLATMTMITGLMLAGAEMPTITSQFVCCTVGIAAFSGGAYWIGRILRG